MNTITLTALILLLPCLTDVEAQSNNASQQCNKKEAHSRLFEKLYLGRNNPNPVRRYDATTIPFRVALDDTQILIFNSQGVTIMTFDELKGKQSVTIDGGQLLPGHYEYCLFVWGRAIKRRKFEVERIR
ncbi:MAG: hypothetical protein WKF87_09115 [Chryseolinea sp.]